MDKDWKKKLADFWLKYERKIILVAGFILVAVISFEGGYLKGGSLKKNGPIIIEKTAAEAQNCESCTNSIAIKSEQSDQNIQKKECLFVASKNSKKYHVPSCTWAKRIKPENIICFSSKEEATKAGYQPDACVK